MTTAKTSGPRVSPMFTPESMAASRLQLWIHGTDGVDDDEIGRGAAGQWGRERLGKGGLFDRRRDAYKRYPRNGNPGIPVTHSMEAYPLMSMSPAHAPHSRTHPEREPNVSLDGGRLLSVRSPGEGDPFLFGNKPHPDLVGRAIHQAAPLLRIYYSVDQDCG